MEFKLDYKFFHLLGAISIISGLVFVAVCNHLIKKPTIKMRLYGSIFHGLGMISVILSGLQLVKKYYLSVATSDIPNNIMSDQIASTQQNQWPIWVKYKIVIWLLLGLSISLAKRNSKYLLFNIFIFLLLAGFAIQLALTKAI